MNFEALNAVITPRTHPDESIAPREQLYRLFRELESLRELRKCGQDPQAISDLDRRITFYERILE